MATAKRIGFLATGSEIVNGEIVNTNSQQMAEKLHADNMTPGEHLMCDDEDANIAAALQFLLSRHDAVIITGGLGPTSDDRTRFVVAALTHQELVFNEESFARLSARILSRGYTVTDNNRQQALFPQNATVLKNDNGTADGCALSYHDKWIFMLPGPPHEALPIFERDVLPLLRGQNFAHTLQFYRWRLSGIGESRIAHELSEAVEKPYGLMLGYRAHRPYVDIKIMLDPTNKTHDEIRAKIEAIVMPYVVK